MCTALPKVTNSPEVKEKEEVNILSPKTRRLSTTFLLWENASRVDKGADVRRVWRHNIVSV